MQNKVALRPNPQNWKLKFELKDSFIRNRNKTMFLNESR
jgi:hypothetical protein